MRLAPALLVSRAEPYAPVVHQVGVCPVCGRAVRVDDNFVSWKSRVTHFGCAFAADPAA